MQTLLLWMFYISSFYAFIPGMITRIFGFRVFRRGKAKQAFSLTFDDGPDPHYTPQLLDLLKQYNAKGTFFVVGINAEQHPELIKRMHDEGHLIGIHNYIHKTNWLMRPRTVRNQIMKTDKIIHAITGERTSYYRPPWGIVNMFDFSKRNQFKIVLWSSMFGDWRESTGADRLAKRMLSKLKPGEVMLLHDCGSTVGANANAPEQMLIALKKVLQEAQQRDLHSIRIDEMISAKESVPEKKISRGKLVAVKLWLLWEMVFHFIFRLQTVTPNNPFLHYRLRSYHGKDMMLDDGTILHKGDKVIELHFDNEKLFNMGIDSRSVVHLAIKMIRSMEKELPLLAQQLMKNDDFKDVKALYGVSMINRGPEKFGFSILDLPEGWFAKSTGIYLKILLRFIHPAGQDRLKGSSEKLIPKMIVMPIEQLNKYFAVNGSHRNSNAKADEQGLEVEEEQLSSISLLGVPQGLGSTPPIV